MLWRKRQPQSVKRHLDLERAKRAIVRVGKFGRGFLVGDVRNNGDGLIWRDVVTAASCLPCFPSFNPFSMTENVHLYAKIIGNLDQEPSIDAECRFADPVSNLAVLGSTSDEYAEFIHWDVALQIAAPKLGEAGAECRE